jgi:hypothetical protein
MRIPLAVWLLLGSGLGVLVITGVVVAFLSLDLGNRVTAENFKKLQLGMTEAQVTGILGRPTRDATAGGGLGAPVNPRARILVWESGQNTIVVTLVDGRVTGLSGSFTGPAGP